MTALTRLVHAWRTLTRGAQLDAELDEELRAYVDDLTARHVAKGLEPAAARRAALVETGGIEQVKDRVRETRNAWLAETFWRDVRYGVRSLQRSPGFAAVVIATLALVIGANTTVFSVMHAVLWRDLPYPQADRLVVLDADLGVRTSVGLAGGEIGELAAEPGLFAAVTQLVRVDAHVTVGDEMERVMAASVSNGALTVFDPQALAFGRPLEVPRDIGLDGYVRSVVISHDLWQRRLGGEPSALGRHIEVNNLDVEIVGILRQDFRLFVPLNATLPEVVDIWFARPLETDRSSRGHTTIAMLAPGVTLAAARARLTEIGRRNAVDHAGAYPVGAPRLSLRSLKDDLTADARQALWVLAGAVSFVLLIGCVNVGNLLLARARVRAPEMAMRRALGAGRARLTSQLLTESAILVGLGGLGGVLLAIGGVSLIEWLRPVHLPRQSQVAVNGTVILYTALLSGVVTLAFGLLPLAGLGATVTDPLRGGRSGVQRHGARRLQRSLVIAEVALSIVPLVAAGLMLRSFANLTAAPLGFTTTGVVTAKAPFSVRQFREPRQRVQLVRDAIARVGELPGVDAASAAGPVPLEDNQFTRLYGRGTDADPPSAPATVQSVMPGYLAIVGTTLRAGRDFSDDDMDQQRRVVIVDQRLADRLWPDGALGQTLAVALSSKPVLLEVVGVTEPVRVRHVREGATPHLFVPFDMYGLQMALFIKTGAGAAAIGPAVKEAVEALNTRRPVHSILPLQHYVDVSMTDTRFLMLVLVAFAGVSLLLAAIGLYGTLAYVTAQRTQEFGVRMALGASPLRVLRSVAGEGLTLTVVGTVVGFAGASFCSVWLTGMLYDVTPLDVPTFAAVSALVAVVAVIAASHPAWRAARVDPTVALRAE